MTRLLSLAHLTALETSPPDLIRMAADAGFGGAGLRLIGLSAEATAWPLMNDAALMRETQRACRETGLIVPDIEFIRLTPELDVATLESFMAAGAALGAKHVISAPYDPDFVRLADKLAALQALASRYGLSTVIEFFPWTHVKDLATALSVVDATRDPRIGVLVDSLHFDRSGVPWDELARVAPSRLPFVHLADAAPLTASTNEALIFVARENRLAPGEGAIDLVRFLNTVPADIPLSVEVPNSARLQDLGPAQWIAHVSRATRRLLQSVGAQAEGRS